MVQLTQGTADIHHHQQRRPAYSGTGACDCMRVRTLVRASSLHVHRSSVLCRPHPMALHGTRTGTCRHRHIAIQRLRPRMDCSRNRGSHKCPGLYGSEVIRVQSVMNMKGMLIVLGPSASSGGSACALRSLERTPPLPHCPTPHLLHHLVLESMLFPWVVVVARLGHLQLEEVG